VAGGHARRMVVVEEVEGGLLSCGATRFELNQMDAERRRERGPQCLARSRKPVTHRTTRRFLRGVRRVSRCVFVCLLVCACVCVLSHWVHTTIDQGSDLPALKCSSHWSLGLFPVSVVHTCLHTYLRTGLRTCLRAPLLNKQLHTSALPLLHCPARVNAHALISNMHSHEPFRCVSHRLRDHRARLASSGRLSGCCRPRWPT
jgi:hypothetical protein